MTNLEDPFEKFQKPNVPLEGINTTGVEKSKLPTLAISTALPSEELSEFTRQLQSLQRRVPVVADKALINLVNGIQISSEAVRYRKSQGFFGRLMDQFSGRDRQRGLLVEGNLISGQAALHQWTLELSNSLEVSRVGLAVTQKSLEITQQSLLEARNVIRNQKENIDELKQFISNLSQSFEVSIRQLEVRMSAKEDFDKIVKAWVAGRTYSNLPWAVQIVLLAREIFSSSISTYELQSGNLQYRQRLIDELNAEIRHRNVPKQFDGFGDLLDRTWTLIQDQEDQSLSASLLETRSVQFQQIMNIPLLFTIGTTFELFMVPLAARPKSPGHCAIELCRTQISDIPNLYTPQEFIEAIVDETANYCLSVISSPTCMAM